MKSKAPLFIEYLWLGIVIASLLAGLHQWYYEGFKNSSPFFVMLFISILMFTFRRHLRLKNKTESDE